MIKPRNLAGEALAPWNNTPVFGHADKSEQRPHVARIDDTATRPHAARATGKSDRATIVGASTHAKLMRSASAKHPQGAALKDSGVRKALMNHGVHKLADDLAAGSTTLGAHDFRVTREEAA